jgi:hypothetical protein
MGRRKALVDVMGRRKGLAGLMRPGMGRRKALVRMCTCTTPGITFSRQFMVE